MSRLQAGAMAVQLRAVALEEVVAGPWTTSGPGGAVVRVDLPRDLPTALVDPGLLERVLVNVVANTLRYSPADRPPRLLAATVGAGAARQLEVRLVDRGPGSPRTAATSSSPRSSAWATPTTPRVSASAWRSRRPGRGDGGEPRGRGHPRWRPHHGPARAVRRRSAGDLASRSA